jgi:hypothetical protein
MLKVKSKRWGISKGERRAVPQVTGRGLASGTQGKLEGDPNPFLDDAAARRKTAQHPS